MDHFELVSQYKPTGDQPQAIEDLVKGFKEEISARHCLVSPDLVRHLRWRMLFSRSINRRLSLRIIRLWLRSYMENLKSFSRIMR